MTDDSFVRMGYALEDLFLVAANRPDGVHLIVERGLSEPVLVDNANCVYLYVPETTALLPVATIVENIQRTPAITAASECFDHDAGFDAFHASRLHALRARRLLERLLDGV